MSNLLTKHEIEHHNVTGKKVQMVNVYSACISDEMIWILKSALQLPSLSFSSFS